MAALCWRGFAKSSWSSPRSRSSSPVTARLRRSAGRSGTTPSREVSAPLLSKLAEAYEHLGVTAETLGSEGRVDPRGYDVLGTMVCWHVKPLLGDQQLKPEVMED